MPEISIILPTYNRPHFIRETIGTLLTQRFQDFEIVVADSSTNDETLNVVRSLNDARIIHLRQPKNGPSAARNAGIRSASGAYLVFMDDDNAWLPDSLLAMRAALLRQPDAGVAYGWLNYMDEAGDPVDVVRGSVSEPPLPSEYPAWQGVTLHPVGTLIEGDVLAALLLEPESTIDNGAALIRRDFVETIGGFDVTLSHQEQTDFFLRLAQAGAKFVCCRQVVLLQRNHPGGLHQNLDAMYACRLCVFQKVFGAMHAADPLLKQAGECHRLHDLEYGGKYFGAGVFDKASACVNAVERSRPLSTPELHELAETLAHGLAQQAAAPAAEIETHLRGIENTSTRKRLVRQASALYEFALASHAHRSNKRGDVVRHGLSAIRLQPALVKNKGLLSILMRSVVTVG